MALPVSHPDPADVQSESAGCSHSGPLPSFAPGLSSLRSEMIGTARPSLVPTYAMLDKGDGPFRLGVGARSAASGPTGECSPASECGSKRIDPRLGGTASRIRSTSQYPVVVNLAGGGRAALGAVRE